MTTVRELVTKWGFRVDDRPLRRIDARVNRLKSSLSGLVGLSTKIGIGFGALSFGIGRLLQEAGNFEQIEIAFEVLTQSQEKAIKLQKDLINFAVTTPFQLKGVFDASKQLLAYGIEAENMIDTMTALGNVAAGVGREKLPQLVLAFGQVRAAGRLRGQEVRQFTEAGVPINEIVAKEFGIATSEVAKFVSSGQVDFKRFNKGFQELANGTGRFTGLMEKQSRSLLGVYSNFKDLIQVTAATIGKTLIPEAQEYLKIAIGWLDVNKKLIQTNVGIFVRNIIRGMEKLAKVGQAAFRVIKAGIKILGGFENAVKLVTSALAVMLGLRVLSFMGHVGLVMLSAAKNMLVFAAASRTAGLSMLAMQAIGLAIPLAIGAAFAGLFLLVEDFIVFMQGGKSVIGALVNDNGKGQAAFLKFFDKFETQALAKIRAFFDRVSSFLSDDQFAEQRQKIADGLLAALDVAVVGTGLLAKIGFRIGQAIFDGVVEAFVDGSPKLAGFLGLTSKRTRKKGIARQGQQNDITGAASNINKFGFSAASQANPGAAAQARQFTESKSAKFAQSNTGKGFADFIDPSGDLGRALADSVITVQELQNNIRSIKKLEALSKGKFNPRELILSGTGKPASQTGKNPAAPIKFETKIEVHGSGLDQASLTKAIEDGVNQGQMKTATELATEAQSSIAE